MRLSGSGEVEAVNRLPTPHSAEEIVEVVLTVASRVFQNVDPSPTLPLGVGCPGMVDRQGVPHFCPHLHASMVLTCAPSLPGAGPRGRRRSCPTTPPPHAGPSTPSGRHKGTTTSLMVTLGTGIGGGAVMDGQARRGAHGFAGEIGHMVVDPLRPSVPVREEGLLGTLRLGERPREVGQRRQPRPGRLEQWSRLAGGDPEAVRGEHVTAAALDGDPEALEVMTSFCLVAGARVGQPGQRPRPFGHRPRWGSNRGRTGHLWAASGTRLRRSRRGPRGTTGGNMCPLTSASVPARSAPGCSQPSGRPAAGSDLPPRWGLPCHLRAAR